MKPSPRLLLIVVAVLIVASLVATYCQRRSRSEDAAKRNTLDGIYAELPIYPDFQEAARNSFSKDLLASLGKPYNSEARYLQVRAFYCRETGSLFRRLTTNIGGGGPRNAN
jgi:hypothetical protein